MPKKLSNALTPLAVKNAKPGRHADGGGLHLLVKQSGARSWVYRFMLVGRDSPKCLGQIDLTPASADHLARAGSGEDRKFKRQRGNGFARA